MQHIATFASPLSDLILKMSKDETDIKHKRRYPKTIPLHSVTIQEDDNHLHIIGYTSFRKAQQYLLQGTVLKTEIFLKGCQYPDATIQHPWDKTTPLYLIYFPKTKGVKGYTLTVYDESYCECDTCLKKRGLVPIKATTQLVSA